MKAYISLWKTDDLILHSYNKIYCVKTSRVFASSLNPWGICIASPPSPPPPQDQTTHYLCCWQWSPCHIKQSQCFSGIINSYQVWLWPFTTLHKFIGHRGGGTGIVNHGYRNAVFNVSSLVLKHKNEKEKTIVGPFLGLKKRAAWIGCSSERTWGKLTNL